MNIFDIIIVLMILIFGIQGSKNGIIKEGVSFIGTIVVFIASYLLKGYIGNILCDIFPFFNFSGSIEGLTAINILLYQVIGFILVFGILMTIYHTLFFASKIVQRLLNMTIILIIPSKILGFIVGIVKGYLIMFAVLLVLVIPLRNQSILNESKFRDKILYETPIVSNYTSNITNSLEEVYKLTEDIEQSKITAEDANLQILRTMLDYNVVSKDKVDELIVRGKLAAEGANELLEEYE